jgi:membrane-bound lytic murein transglycosylase F
MIRGLKKSPVYIILSISIFCHCGIKDEKDRSANPEDSTSFTNIIQREVLSALTDYNSTNYFVYREQPVGFNYEILKKFADHINVELDIGISSDLNNSFTCLLNKNCDIIAMDLTITKERAKLFNFTIPLSETRQVLVQRKPKNWFKMKSGALDQVLIRNQLDLAGKEIYVQSNSSFAERLENLSHEIGAPIHIVEIDSLSEELIMMVATGEIDYTVTDEHIALNNQKYFRNIDVKTAISFPQKLAWAIHKESTQLQDTLNSWLHAFLQTKEYHNLYNRYFKASKNSKYVSREFLDKEKGLISPFDDVIKTLSDSINWDWRLLASLIYQESQFEINATSWAGAYGLMQLMPKTAKEYGIDTSSSIYDHIYAGVLYIRKLNSILPKEINDKNERIRFLLAAYNVGIAHVLDARNLAEKYGKNPNIWTSHVDTYILKKSNPRYYNDSVVKYGYCRGTETYRFVIDIFERYEVYKDVIRK